MKIIHFVFVTLLFLNGINAQGQNKMHFSFSYDAEIKASIVARIVVLLPDGGVSQLYSGTLFEYKLVDKSNFISKGKYKLLICFKAEEYGQDSINYDFELKGGEMETFIDVNFDFSEKLLKEGDVYKKGDKVLNGYIRVSKYYEAPNTIEIKPYDGKISRKSNQGPIFKIKNNSTDTLYGEHLPGYFWGTLSYLKNDSICKTIIGMLDYNFIDLPPLYPDSLKTASVGSFGIRKLPPAEYRFEVMVAKKWQSTGIGIYKEQKDFIWWAGTKEYYRLKYDFKVE